MELVSIKSKSRKRVGRGLSSGQGKTAGRGTKGQKSRSGYNIPRKFEGGQTPLSMRLAKLPGFKSIHEKAVIVSLDQISANYKAGDEISLKSLVEKGLINKTNKRVKVLNNGTLTVAVKFAEDIKVSKSISEVKPAAKAEKVEKADEPETVIPEKAGIQEKTAVKTEAPKKSPAKKPVAKKPSVPAEKSKRTIKKEAK